MHILSEDRGETLTVWAVCLGVVTSPIWLRAAAWGILVAAGEQPGPLTWEALLP